MRILFLLLTCLPIVVYAQDYTIFGQSDTNAGESEGSNTMLVVPFHAHYMISEVDRLITPQGMDVHEMREKLRKRCTMVITQSLNDSLDAIDLSIANEDLEIDLLDYVYNSLDYRYVEFEEQEAEKGRFKIKLPKKKEKREYGAYSTERDGQLDRVELNHDRYMSASFGNPGALDYLQDIHAFDYILTITQLEIKRNLETATDAPYFISLHYELMDSSGEQMKGGKQDQFLQQSEMDMTELTKRVLPSLASLALVDIWQSLDLSAPSSKDFSDY